jgi:hypothetical protein
MPAAVPNQRMTSSAMSLLAPYGFSGAVGVSSVTGSAAGEP